MSDAKKPAKKGFKGFKEALQVGMAVALFGVGTAAVALWAAGEEVHRVPLRDESTTEEELVTGHFEAKLNGIVRVDGNPGGAFDYDVAIKNRVTAFDFYRAPGIEVPDREGDDMLYEDLLSPTDGGNSPANDDMQRGGFMTCHMVTAYYPDGKESQTVNFCSGVYWGQWNIDRLWRYKFISPQHGFGTYEYRGFITWGEVRHCGWGVACWDWKADDFAYAFNLNRK